MRTHRLLALLAVPVIAVAATVVTAGSAATTENVPMPALLGPDRVAGADDVPWDRVGDGWYLTAVDQGPRAGSGWIRPSHQLVQLVNPRGGRYTMWRNTVRHGRGLVRLVDWSADARVALLTSEVDMGHLRAIAVDLRTGERQQLVLPTSVAAVALRPGGAGVVATTYGDGDADSRELLSVDWTGAQRVVFRGLGGNALVSPDGSRVVTGPTTAQGSALRVIDTATGGVTDEIATPAGCDPYRWWAVDVVAARCWGEHQSLQVWTFPLDGSPATQLSTFHGRASEDLGDLDARVLGGRTYLQASGSCGYVFLARDHRRRPGGGRQRPSRRRHRRRARAPARGCLWRRGDQVDAQPLRPDDRRRALDGPAAARAGDRARAGVRRAAGAGLVTELGW